MSDMWSHSHDWDNGYAVGHKDGYQRGRDEAVNEFCEKAKVQIDFSGKVPQICMRSIYTILDEVAEQIKEQKNEAR